MGTGPLQRLVSSGGWPLGGVLSTHSPPMVPPSLARESQHACPFYHPLGAVRNTETISQHSGINKTSRWHEIVPQGITRMVSSFYISSMLDESGIYSEIVFIIIMLRVCHIITTDIAFVLHFYVSIYFIIIMIILFFSLSTSDPVLTPPGSFNSTITQHSTISARASAG